MTISESEDWIEKREVPDLFGPQHVGVLQIHQVASFWRRFIHFLNKRGGCFSEHTRRYYIELEGSVPQCHFHISIFSVWDGSAFKNEFTIWADKRLGFSLERFQELIDALKPDSAKKAS